MKQKQYRAWHEKEQRMFEVYDILWENDEIAWVRIAPSRLVPVDMVILMRPIGKVDKNDKPIYESDILKYENGDVDVVRWSDVMLRFTFGKLEQYIDEALDSSKVEVLGDTYRNVGLITPQEDHAAG